MELRKIEFPEHLKDLTEFRLLDEVSEMQMKEYYSALLSLHDDLLITTATKEGITRREKILGILPDPALSLSARRAKVLFWWYNRMPYSRKVLESKVAALCGEGHYSFTYDTAEEVLHVGIDLCLGWDVIDVVKELLDRLVMLNVVLDIRGRTNDTQTESLHLGAFTRSYMKGHTLSDHLDCVAPVQTALFAGCGKRVCIYDKPLTDHVRQEGVL